MTDPSYLYRVMCCGLKAATKLLDDQGWPVPETAQTIFHKPALTCGCDSLYVYPGGSRALPEGKGKGPNQADKCFNRREITFYVSLMRCVHLTNPLTGDCYEDGNCADVLTCPGDTQPPRPATRCEEGAPNKATETLWLAQERWLFESDLACAWTRCLTDGWCNEGCDQFPETRTIKYSRTSEPEDSGGCGGSTFEFSIRYP